MQTPSETDIADQLYQGEETLLSVPVMAAGIGAIVLIVIILIILLR